MSKVMSRQNYFRIHAATLFDAFHAAKFAPYDKTYILQVWKFKLLKQKIKAHGEAKLRVNKS